MSSGLMIFAAMLLSALGLWLCFPNRPSPARWAGAGLALAGLLLAAVGIALWSAVLPGSAVLAVAMILGLLGAGRMVVHRNAVYCAVYLGVVIICAAVMALLAGAEFLAISLVIVYAGAILVAYIFVIMLAQRAAFEPYDLVPRKATAAVLAALATAVAVMLAALRYGWPARAGMITYKSNVAAVGAVLYSDYAFAVELAGLLLLVAIIGGLLLARSRPDAADR